MHEPSGSPPAAEGQKIVVDTDWKSQAQAEKERLAAAERAKAARAVPGAAPVPGAQAAMPTETIQPDFFELVRMLATQALMYLGGLPEPESGRRLVILDLAQFHIDLLQVLEQKTKGNLTDQEKDFLARMLYELRMQFVEISKAVARAVEEGRVRPTAATAPAAPASAGVRVPPASTGA